MNYGDELEMELDLDEFIDTNKQFLKDMNDYVFEKSIHSFIEDEEVEALIKGLNKVKKNNILLIGKAGVGKTALVEGLCRLMNLGEVPKFLKDKHIIEFSLGGAISGTKYRGEFEKKVQKALDYFSQRDDVIIFIDEIHNIVGTGKAEGAIGAGDMFKPYMARNTLKLIGATTISEYKKNIKKDRALNRRFSKVLVKEPSVNKTIKILNNCKIDYEMHYGIELSEDEIRHIVLSSVMKKGNFPDKAFDSLEDYCYYKSKGDDVQ